MKAVKLLSRELLRPSRRVRSSPQPCAQIHPSLPSRQAEERVEAPVRRFDPNPQLPTDPSIEHTFLQRRISSQATQVCDSQAPSLRPRMASTTYPPTDQPPQLPKPQPLRRVNGKSWHPARKHFNPTSARLLIPKHLSIPPTSTSSTTTSKPIAKAYSLRRARDALHAAVKSQERELKAEKEEARARKVQGIKDKRAAREERERFAEMEVRMHRKRVERLRRREKRNRLIRSGK